MSLFEQSPNEEKKRSLFDSSWQSNNGEEQAADFTSLSVPAVLALVGGLLSLLVFFSTTFLFIPIATLLLVVWALLSIHRSEGHLTGARFAYAGLFLLIVPVVAVTVNDAIYRAQLTRQAKAYFQTVFANIQRGDLPAILQSRTPYFTRRTDLTEVDFWKEQIAREDAHENIHSEFLSNPILRTLITLGDRAQITYVKTESIYPSPAYGKDEIRMVYAVTYPGKDGGKETFFIPVVGIRSHDPEKKRVGWGRNPFGLQPLPADFQ